MRLPLTVERQSIILKNVGGYLAGLIGPLQTHYFDLCLGVAPLFRPVIRAAMAGFPQGITWGYVWNNNNIFELLLFRYHS